MEKTVKQHLAEKSPENLAFLKNWANANEETFARCMSILAEDSPLKFAEIYVRVKTLTQPKETKTDINVSITNNSAIEKLATLASVNDSSRRIEAPNRKTEYAEFQEVK